MIASSSILLAGCGPVAPTKITGTEQQKMEKMSQIIASGGSASCTVTNLEDKSVVEYVISGKKIKMTGNKLGGDEKGTIISDTKYIYSWSDGQKTGFKMKNPTEEEIKANAEEAKKFEESDPAREAQTFEDETKFKMECVKRGVPDSEFVPPANVKFIDPTEMQNLSPEDIKGMIPSEK